MNDPREHVVRLFHDVAETVPAYRQFLHERDIDPATIRNYADFVRLPLLDKTNYTRRYPLPQLCRNGRLSEMIAVSSGSTGEPSFWPRSTHDERVIAARFEQIFRDAFDARKRRTLAVICFALGTWVGGLFTFACCRELAARGYPVTVVAPGNNPAEILRVVPQLAPHVDQVVLLGYPPFLKDVIDAGRAAGVPWEDYRLALVGAGEVFSEEWRTLVCQRAGITDPTRRTASLYGTADAGVLGNETPLSIEIRRFLAAEPDLARDLFGESRLPTLVQYDPLQRFFETSDGTLLFTGDSGAPLIRYHIADTGGIIEHDDLLAAVRARGFTPVSTGPAQPFVYVFGRSHFTVSYYGANVFPENITVGLERPNVSRWVTGKFVLEVVEDADRDRTLQVTVELAPGLTPPAALADDLADTIHAELRRLNSEFANYVPAENQRPRVVLRPHADPRDFPAGVKHRYTRGPG